jgi:hypothetical protein
VAYAFRQVIDDDRLSHDACAPCIAFTRGRRLSLQKESECRPRL